MIPTQNIDGLWEEMNLPCGKVAVKNADGFSYTCRHCNKIVGSADEPADCKAKREQQPPRGNDWWLIDGDYKDEQTNDR
jgi:NAD-dependent SIR2 family protein deacetylase